MLKAVGCWSVEGIPERRLDIFIFYCCRLLLTILKIISFVSFKLNQFIIHFDFCSEFNCIFALLEHGNFPGEERMYYI